MDKREKELLILKTCIIIFAVAAVILLIIGALSLLGNLHYNFHIIPCVIIIALLIFALIPYVKLKRTRTDNDNVNNPDDKK